MLQLRALFVINFISDLGTYLSWVQLTAFVYKETHSAPITALFFLLQRVPKYFFSGWAGRNVTTEKSIKWANFFGQLIGGLSVLPLMFSKLEIFSFPLFFLLIAIRFVAGTFVDVARMVAVKTYSSPSEMAKNTHRTILLQNLAMGVGSLISAYFLVGKVNLSLRYDFITYMVSAFGVLIFLGRKSAKPVRFETIANKISLIEAFQGPFKTLLWNRAITALLFGSEMVFMSIEYSKYRSDSAILFGLFISSVSIASLAALISQKIFQIITEALWRKLLVGTYVLFLAILFLSPHFNFKFDNLFIICISSIQIYMFLVLFSANSGWMNVRLPKEEVANYTALGIKIDIIAAVFLHTLVVLMGSVFPSSLIYITASLAFLACYFYRAKPSELTL